LASRIRADRSRRFDRRFPTVHFSNNDLLVDGDKVVARWTCTGTHRGPFVGLAPTGKRVTFIGINIFRLRDGKIVERWAIEDVLSLMQQLRSPA
jgi:predicted ester cyclase